MKNILVTGGAGFIGSNFIRFLLEQKENYKIVNVDLLTYAGNLKNLNDLEDLPEYIFYKGDIRNNEFINFVIEKEKIDTIINFAAESHVDRSIINSYSFISTNISGTVNLLEAVKRYNLEKFLQISTDEVYGSLGETGKFTEATPLSPNSPYSASKAAADMIVKSYFHTHNLPVLITRCSNNYGPYQFPEKLIPLMIINAINNKHLPVYGDGMNIRDWIYVRDHCNGIYKVLQNGRNGEVYNLGGNCEKPNIEIVRFILKTLGKDESLIKFVKDRPGHDRRYAIDFSKAEKELNWKPVFSFEESLTHTIDWYLKNSQWWMDIMSGDYMNYYSLWYGDR